MLKISFHAMGCEMAAFIDCESQPAAVALGKVPGWFEEWEQVLSRFRPDSELSQLNATAGQPFHASPILWRVMKASLWAANWTGGLVVPTMLQAIQAAGYDRSFEMLGYADPKPNAFWSSTPLSGDPEPLEAWQNIQLNEQDRTIALPAGARIDLGGVAKGWAARQAAQLLKNYGPALVDASGDIAVTGPCANSLPWTVDVADPLGIQDHLCQVMANRCGIATSGVNYRHWLKDGIWKHHIIDPRTGEPAQTDIISATVIASEVIQAEAAAKTVMILGSRSGKAWLEGQPALAGLLVCADGRMLYSQNFTRYIRREYVNQIHSIE